MRDLQQLVDVSDPAINVIREWVRDSEVPCEVLPPSPDRDSILLGVQVTTHSILGALAYETGGLMIDDGWLRLLGSGHARLPRSLTSWNQGRSDGFYLVGDDVAGGFFAINGGGLGPQHKNVYYWSPDNLEWEDLGLGFTEFVGSFLTKKIEAFYEDLRWSTWREDTGGLCGDRCYVFFPFLWTKEGSVESSHRSEVPVAEAFDMKVDIVKQLNNGA
jgi:hypothetical protein